MKSRKILASLTGLAVTAVLAHAAAPVWRPFSDDSPWNKPIPQNAPLDPNSESLIADFASRGALFININDWSIPLNFVDADNTPKHDVGDSRPGVYGAGFEFPRSIPIPDNAVTSPPIGENSDNHLCIVDRAQNLEWGMWAARKDDAGRWFTGLGAVSDLSGTGVAPPWFEAEREFDSHRARAGGFPLVAGLIRAEEIEADRIDHALVFAYDHCRGGFFVPPASTAQVTMQDMSAATGIPMGGRIQLDPSWDVENSVLSESGKTIARALQEYGAYCGDFAGANVLYAENSPEAVEHWAGVLDQRELESVFTPEMIRRNFRVLDMGTVLPGQNCPVPPPYILDVRFPGTETSSKIDFFSRTIEVTIPRTNNMAKLEPAFRLFPEGSAIENAGAGGGKAFDYSQPIRLVLTAPDGSANEWTVLVETR